MKARSSPSSEERHHNGIQDCSDWLQDLPLILLAVLSPTVAAAAEDEVLLWPTVRYGWPEKLSAGVAVQPHQCEYGFWILIVDRLRLRQGAGAQHCRAGASTG